MTRQQWPSRNQQVFQRGRLWDRLRSTSARALDHNALEPIKTESCFVTDGGVRFLVRIVSSLHLKPRQDNGHNPFLPFETLLHVADASKTHACVLNKYKVVDLHLLIVTRQFEHQETLLTRDDFHAWWRCLAEYPSLGFYNSGTTSGASQSHKHMQMIPLPIASDAGGPAVPIEPLIDAAKIQTGKVGRVDTLPFAHALVRWNFDPGCDLDQCAGKSLRFYREMLSLSGIRWIETPQCRIDEPYNLIVTRRWMLLVPRIHECFQSISLNSLAFAGALLVQDNAQLEQLRNAGPIHALKWAAAYLG